MPGRFDFGDSAGAGVLSLAPATFTSHCAAIHLNSLISIPNERNYLHVAAQGAHMTLSALLSSTVQSHSGFRHRAWPRR